jgi:hypothetical protein
MTSGLCLAQEGVRGKGQEIGAIKSLLETLTLKECIVTLDALGCQTEIARKMLERGGDYLLAVRRTSLVERRVYAIALPRKRGGQLWVKLNSKI